MTDTFEARSNLSVGTKEYEIFRLERLGRQHDLRKLPYSLKILLENLLRHEDGDNITADDINALAGWDSQATPSQEIAFTPARVLLQDFTGVPVVVDLAAMRDAMRSLGGDPTKINPLAPVELVIDHSVQVDSFGRADSFDVNTRIEFARNKERYAFLRWGQKAFDDFKVVPPGTGIVHQINLEYLARVVFERRTGGVTRAYPDTLVGTDSHTTMINALGVLGWGVGGIEAEAAMLGQPVTMLIPQVVGVRLTGKLSEGVTATDLVLTVTQKLRERNVVGKFVEFFGEGIAELALADRATIANMAPEYGATCGLFPIDHETLRYLALTGRSKQQLALVEAYARCQGLFRDSGDEDVEYSDVLELDLNTVMASLAGPTRPQDRIDLSQAKQVIGQHLLAKQKQRASEAEAGWPPSVHESAGSRSVRVEHDGQSYNVTDGAVVLAAITSCTNTSNPQVMVGAGLLARNARAYGLNVQSWVKTSFAPGSKVVKDYLDKAGLLADLEYLGFHLVGYGCTTCIGNSGPLPEHIDEAVREGDLIVSAILSGNRNFEGRIHADVTMNFLGSPPLVVAYALAGTMAIDLHKEPIGRSEDGNDIYLKDIWPSGEEIQQTIAECVTSEMFRSRYENVFEGDEGWKGMEVPSADRFSWDVASTYVRHPPYFDGMTMAPRGMPRITEARALLLLGDSITTDHISPAGAIAPDSPAGVYLRERQVPRNEFNSYGARRGNHEVMMRGTFANVRLRNRLAPDTEGGWTTHQPSGELMTVFDAAMRYKEEGVPLVILGGSEYGTGSSRDWAAKGPLLLGVAVVIAKSFERIHRSNLVGMGVLPLMFEDGEDAEVLGLTGAHTFDIEGLVKGAKQVQVLARGPEGPEIRFTATVRIDTPKEEEYFVHGGILHYVIRQLAA